MSTVPTYVEPAAEPVGPFLALEWMNRESLGSAVQSAEYKPSLSVGMRSGDDVFWSRLAAILPRPVLLSIGVAGYCYRPTADEVAKLEAFYNGLPAARVVPDVPYPLAGDVVELTTDRVTCVKPGALAVIGGMIGQRMHQMTLTTFAYSAFRGDSFRYAKPTRPGCVSCSGGPAPWVNPWDLEPTGKTVSVPVWQWFEDARANGGLYYRITVRKWRWAGERTPAPQMRTLAELTDAAELFGLTVDGSRGGAGKFRDIYIGTGAKGYDLEAFRDAVKSRGLLATIDRGDVEGSDAYGKSWVTVGSFWCE